MNLFSRLIFTSFLTILLFTSALADGAAPSWLKQAAAVQTPTYAKDVPAVVLHNEQEVTIDTNGKLVKVENYAIKILLREGKNLAVATAFYLSSFNKVRDMSGWLIRPDGSVKEFGKKDILDVIADSDDVYNEGRIKVIDASGEVDAGYIFGYTVTTEDTPLFYQDNWSFQGRFPTMLSRYTLNLPSGWKASSFTFNHEKVAPQTNNSSYVWEPRYLQSSARHVWNPPRCPTGTFTSAFSWRLLHSLR